ncbi:malto-oligosyltrehalose trehalohydrolase [Cutibacterium acnes JCM 18920]|nr:malto-oligosyltrehalose trehalohydrolase [Cutibacterium acnes JCM 18920]
MHVGTFFDKDPNDDKPAELGDVESKIDHLTHLGVNAVELMPLMEFAGDYSWGYNPAHIFAVESAYDAIQPLRPSSCRPTAPLLCRERNGVTASQM